MPFGPVSVPDLPGVPTGLNFATVAASAVQLLTSDVISYFGGNFGPQWGIFQGGAPVIIADSVISVEYRKESILADYVMESGSFASYDKVQIPFDVRVRFAAGSQASKAGLLASIAAIADDTNLYSMVMPETTFPNVNISHIEFRRSAPQGVGLLVIDVWALEVRQAAGPSLSSSADPSATPLNPDGKIEATTPTTAQMTAVGTIPSLGTSGNN